MYILRAGGCVVEVSGGCVVEVSARGSPWAAGLIPESTKFLTNSSFGQATNALVSLFTEQSNW